MMKKTTFWYLLFISFLFQLSYSQSWLTEGPLFDNITGSARQHHLAIDSNNNNYVLLYQIVALQNYVVKYDGTDWNTLGPYISDGTLPNTSSNRNQSITIDDSDNVYVAYVDPSLTNKVAVKTWNGTAWVYVGSSNGIAINVSGIDNVVIKSFNNSLYITYFVPGLGIVVGRYNSSTSGWNLIGSFNISSSATNLDLAINSNDTPYLVYQDISNNNYITVKKFDGTDWVLVGSPIPTFGELQKIALKNDDTPVIAYVTVSTTAALNVKSYNGTSWVNEGNAVPSSVIPLNQGTADLSFVISSNNVPYVAYTENLTNQLGKVVTLNNMSNNWEELPASNVPTGPNIRYNTLAIDSQDILHYVYQRNNGPAKCVFYNATLSTNNLKTENSISLFPNPTSNNFTIGSKFKLTQISILDVQGKIVKSFEKNLEVYKIDDLTSGLYFVNIETEQGKTTKKLIKK